MYSKGNYHDLHYVKTCESTYNSAVDLLLQFAAPGSTVLDYGCGFGHFLVSAKRAGYIPTGAEFDATAASYASTVSGAEVLSNAEFADLGNRPLFDVLHLADVLEHLPDPFGTLNHLMCYVRPGGLVFIEGPLENNLSPVYWASLLFGNIKRITCRTKIGDGVPQHLFRTGQKQQLRFFERFSPELELLYWDVYESGWPYSNVGVIKSAIAILARRLSGIKFFGETFGNRFSAVFRYTPVTRTGI